MKMFFRFFVMAILAISVCACEAPGNGAEGDSGDDNNVEKPVVQEPVLELVNGTFYQINNNGGNVEVEISTNTTYEVNIPEEATEWVSLAETRTETNKILVFAVEKNKSGSSRETKIAIAYDNKSVEFSIYQASSDGEKPERPADALSTLYDNLTKDFAGVAMAYADCFGDYRHYNTGTGQFMWQIYLQDYDARDQLLIEILAPAFERDLVLPLGIFPVADKRWVKDSVIPGAIVWDSEYSCYIESYSWYLRTKKSSTGGIPTWPPVYEDRAPIIKGWLKIEEDPEEEGMHIVSFNFEDDAYNTISGSYRGPIYMSDAR